VQLAYGAHHDAITGSGSDQVYLDLLTGWRDAWELGCAARDNSLAVLSSAVDAGDYTSSAVVWNPLAHNRTDVVTTRLDAPVGAGVRVLDPEGIELPALVEHDGRSVSWLARDVPSLGWRAYRLLASDVSTSWEPVAGAVGAPGPFEISNEVVAPTERMSGLLARGLMVALVRAGVTATCSSADKPRYGHLGVDSNLPDARIALGGPGQNAFTKTVLAAADPAYTVEVDRQLAETGRARVWVPAAAPLTAGWVPSADLRDSRALPVLVIASRDDADLGSAIASVVDDLVDAEVVVSQQATSGPQRFEPRTVALLNRGVPSFAVEADGTLHTALMRSCTGWPSGCWTDEPRRTAPDGSNFQLQRWTHVFDYALVSGGGDWRHAAIPARSAEFSHPLLAVTASGRGRGLPCAGSLLQVDPADSMQLGALKAAGNPLAHGSAQPVDPGRVALRLVETHGGDADVVVRSPLGTVSELHPADLLERPRLGRRGRQLAALHGYQICTVLARLDIPRLFDADDTALAPQAEHCQPLYARYWLHNRGPAPLGGLPVAAHLHPHRATAAAGTEVVLRLTVSSDSSDAPLAGTVALVCPHGWSASPTELPFTLRPGGYLEADVVVKLPPRVGPGLYPLRAQLRVTGDDVPPAWCQVVEDVCLVSVGGVGEAGRLVYLTDGPADVEVTAGDSARLAVTAGTNACADLPLEAHLISPWGTWEWRMIPAGDDDAGVARIEEWRMIPAGDDDAGVVWLDARGAELVRLAAGYEHPGDPRQPDNTHRH
jgi:alpha-mannosidase